MYSVAHSPDADDIFMYYPINFGWVDIPYKFVNYPLDINTLNEEAKKSIYDITAISFALYPFIKNEYALLRTAMSFGNGYGPKLIKKRDKTLKRNFKVALSGKDTTNAMLFKIAYPDARIKYYNFLDIERAVIDGEVDAGVLIHESILNFDSSLVVEREIWDIWVELVGREDIILPLGGMVIRRSIPILRAIEIENILIKTTKIAYNNKNILSKMLIDKNLIRVDEIELERYLSMYANTDSIELLDTSPIDKLFEIGLRYGIYRESIKTEDYLIPKEYKNYRFA